jgi:hypothetical protein
MAEEKIQARMIVEIMGRPVEHVKEALNTMVVKLGAEKGVKILDKKYHDPKQVEKVDNLFTAFSEVEIEFEGLNAFFGTVFNYMPSNIEILSPEKMKLKVDEINSLSNYLLGKLHNYDALSKRLMAERNVLVKKIEELTGKEITELPWPKPKSEKDGGKEDLKKSS